MIPLPGGPYEDKYNWTFVINGEKLESEVRQEIFDRDLVDIGDTAFIVYASPIKQTIKRKETPVKVKPIAVPKVKPAPESETETAGNVDLALAEDPRKKSNRIPERKDSSQLETIVQTTDEVDSDESDTFGDEELAALVREATKIAEEDKISKSKLPPHKEAKSEEEHPKQKEPKPPATSSVTISDKLKRKREQLLSNDDEEMLVIEQTLNLDESVISEITSADKDAGGLKAEQAGAETIEAEEIEADDELAKLIEEIENEDTQDE